MNLLKSTYRGTIQLLSSAEDGEASTLPTVEFQGGEGPEQIMDRIQSFAVPVIREAIEPGRPLLRWEEFVPESGRVWRRRAPLSSRLEFELCGDDRGIGLLLPGDGTERPRVWVPLRAEAEPGRDERAAIGWTAEKPRFSWRYLRVGETPTIEVSWVCEGLYREWAEQVLRRAASLKCRLGGSGEVCRLSPHHGTALAYRGHLPVNGGGRPACRRISLTQPFVLADDGEAVDHDLDQDVPATVEALDFRAILGDRRSRLVSLDDLAQRFAVEVLTAEEALLPDEIPGGMVPGLPWNMTVATAENGNGHKARCWLLTARSQGEGTGFWGQVEWQGHPPRLRFGLGGFDALEAPRIARIGSRRATVGWRVERGDEDGELMCFAIPQWLPAGKAEAALDCRGNGFDREVKARLGGLEERFAIDPGSEVPGNRVFLGPRRWRFYDELHGELSDGEALGEVGGHVRWRRPSGSDDPDTAPTDWAGGSAPVLLVRGSNGEDAPHWGGLYAPQAVPWAALEEVRPELVVPELLSAPLAPALVVTPRSSVPAIWISLWGFICRYDRHDLTLSQGETPEVTAWIARTALELFPAGGRTGQDRLLRSFAPLYAVRDGEPRVFSLEPGTPRPTLRLGRELGGDPRVIEIGEGTFVRCQTAAPGQAPESFGPGRIPGTRCRLPGEAQVAWFALEPGYLLSWDAAGGWRFRGFFAQRGATAELGTVRPAGRTLRVLLGDEDRTGRRAFRLTVEGVDCSWSEATPDQIAWKVTPEMVGEWQRRFFARDRMPSPLAGHEVRIVRQPVDEGPWIFEFLEAEDVSELEPPPGIRVWEPQDDFDDELFASVRRLGDETPGEPLASPEHGAPERPAKRLLRDDDDEGF